MERFERWFSTNCGSVFDMKREVLYIIKIVGIWLWKEPYFDHMFYWQSSSDLLSFIIIISSFSFSSKRSVVSWERWLKHVEKGNELGDTCMEYPLKTWNLELDTRGIICVDLYATGCAEHGNFMSRLFTLVYLRSEVYSCSMSYLHPCTISLSWWYA